VIDPVRVPVEVDVLVRVEVLRRCAGEERRGEGGGDKDDMAETKHTHVLDRHPSATYLVADSNVSDAVGEMVSVGVKVTEAVVLRVPVGVAVAELLCVGVTEAVTLDVAVPVPVGVWLGVRVRVPVSVTDADSDAVEESVRGGVAVMDPLRVTVEVDVLVCD